MANHSAAILGNGAAPDWQHRAALTIQALEYLYLHAFDMISALNHIDDTLPANNPDTIECEEFPGIPPASVTQGMSVLTWLGSGDLKPGDSFRWQFSGCWLHDTFSDRDEYLDGGIDLLGYTEVIDNNTITRIGFEPFQSGDGGVVFDNFVIQGLIQFQPGDYAFDISSPVTLNGGFVLVFFQQ